MRQVLKTREQVQRGVSWADPSIVSEAERQHSKINEGLGINAEVRCCGRLCFVSERLYVAMDGRKTV